MTALHHRPSRRQHHSYSSTSTGANSPRRGSASSFSSEDDDSITPCPLEEQDIRPTHTQRHDSIRPSQLQSERRQPQQPKASRPKSWRDSQQWHFNPLDGGGENDDVDPASLWRNMLAVQRAFGCYNSARMRAAVEMDGGEEEVPVPSKTCLDLLNDSIRQLPEEERRQLDDFLMSNEAAGLRST